MAVLATARSVFYHSVNISRGQSDFFLKLPLVSGSLRSEMRM